MYRVAQNSNSLLAQLDNAINNGESSFNMSEGEQLRDYLPVEVAASRLMLLIEHYHWNGVVNICSSKLMSVRRFGGAALDQPQD